MQVEESPTHQLRQYTFARQRLGELLRAALQIFTQYQADEGVEQCRELLVKLAEDRFNLAVVGQFKRGKSSLMNAVIARELLPTGILPLTSVITSLCFGPQERVLLKRQGWTLTQEISITDLPGFVTEQGNPGNEKGILEARVEMPSAFLRRGLHFVDTPGIGSSRQENTATTYAFLPEADAVIFVTSVEAPFSEAEERFLQDIRQQAHKLFVVVNKVDLLAQNEGELALNYIRAGIGRILGTAQVRLYPLSARLGLEAKLRADEQGIQQSGLREFESDLAAFLAEGKSRVFLLAMADRALRLVGAPALDLEPTPLPETAANANGIPSLKRLREDFTALRSAIQSLDEAGPGQNENETDPSAIQTPLEQAIANSQAQPRAGGERPFLMTRTCPICAAQSQAVYDFFVHWQYAISKDEQARRAFRSAGGFCGVHTWQFQQIAAPQGISEGYAPLVEAAVAELRQQIGESPAVSAAKLGRLLPTGESCPACRVSRQSGADQIVRFLALVSTAEGAASYRNSLGLCLSHLQAALLAAPSKETADFLLREQANRLEELSEDMHSYLLKRAAIRRGLLNENEENAWRRALTQLSGERTAYTHPQKE